MYDRFSRDYDRFVNWEQRLAVELPFIQAWLDRLPEQSQPVTVLDAACGTGMHAIALARLDFSIAGADISAAMIERARENAAEVGAEIRLETAGFGRLSSVFSPGSFDALLCLGNSLPHVLSSAELDAALADFAACLRPGGSVLIQNRNFDLVQSAHSRWMEPQSFAAAGLEQIFVRFYDFDPDGLITFNILILRREGGETWTQQINTTRLRPLVQADLLEALTKAGFTEIESYGGLNGAPFSTAESGNLVISARKSKAGI